MTKPTVNNDGMSIKEFELSQARTTLGRRRYNGSLRDNLAVNRRTGCLKLLAGGDLLDRSAARGSTSISPWSS